MARVSIGTNVAYDVCMYCIQFLLHVTPCGASAVSEVTLSRVKHNRFWYIQLSSVSMTTTCVWGDIP